MIQRDTAGLTAENSELKIRLQNTEQQVHLQDGKASIILAPVSSKFVILFICCKWSNVAIYALVTKQSKNSHNFRLLLNAAPALNEALKSELQRLKMATGQMGTSGGGAMNLGTSPHPFALSQQVFHPNQAMPPFLAMQQQHPNQPLHPLQTQQLQQAALNLNMKGPAPAPNQWQWGDAWSESSSS